MSGITCTKHTVVIILRFEICLDVDNNRWLLATSRLLLITFFLSFHRQILSYRWQSPLNWIISFLPAILCAFIDPSIQHQQTWVYGWCARCSYIVRTYPGRWLIILLIRTQSVNLDWLAFHYNKAAYKCVVLWLVCSCMFALFDRILCQTPGVTPDELGGEEEYRSSVLINNGCKASI